MTVPRSQLVDLDVTPVYHCISRCVRQADLCGKGREHRKIWIENRLIKLAEVFAIQVAGYSVMDNHLHTVVRLHGDTLVDQWSDREVAQRWARIYPPRTKKRNPEKDIEKWVEARIKDTKWLKRTRKRLANFGWFMKALKEPLARMANKEDGCSGTFWEGRYKSIAILDEEALLAVCAYVDLNPLAAGLAELPEEAPYTSLRTRVEHCRVEGHAQILKNALEQSSSGYAITQETAAKLEAGIWLSPFARTAGAEPGREGMLEGFSLAQYLHLIDFSSRIFREGKCRVGQDVPPILKRLGTTIEIWEATLRQLASRSRFFGVAFSFSRERLREAAAKRGVHHLANLNGCSA